VDARGERGHDEGFVIFRFTLWLRIPDQGWFAAPE
jgi:hypothetical protein